MPYPISILRKATIPIDSSVELEDIINGLSDDLVKSGNETELKNNNLRIVTCPEFSSGTTFKDFNKGQVSLIKSGENVTLIFKVYLIEHLIIFVAIMTLGLYGLVTNGLDSLMIRISLFLLIVNFVFCYLMPFMSLDSFVKRQIKRTVGQE